MIAYVVDRMLRLKEHLSEARGVATVEYVGLTVVAVMLVVIVIAYLTGVGLPDIGEAAAGVIDNIIDGFRAIDAAR